MIKEDMLIFVDTKNNNNKFYHLKLDETGTIHVHYGRVGVKGKVETKYGGEREYNSVLKSKIRKGYVISNISLEQNIIEDNKKMDLLELAMSQIEHSDSKVKELIKRLVDKNIHNIVSSTKITFNKDNNFFTTPLGPVTLEGIAKAKDILFEMSKNIINSNKNDLLNNQNFEKLHENYFKIIPTKISNLREKEKYMLLTQEKLNEQFDICNTLEQTIELLKTAPKTVINNEEKKVEEVFKVKIKLLENKEIFNKINDKFNKTKNNQHGNRVNSLNIENIYEVELGKEKENFREDLDNKWELWHGTRVVNLLSILKSGLLMPKNTPGQTTGAMFGYGLYFSDQSTKSLNYCDGMLWNNNKKQDKVYMFLAEVAMGNFYVPKDSTRNNPPKGYDSYFAKGRESGVQNNEMIVFNTNQIKLKYILEIS